MATNYISFAAADNYRLAKSKTLIDLTDDTYYLIQIPKYAFVRSVWLFITTAYNTAGAYVTIGWVGNGETAQAAGFMSAEIADCTAAGLKIAMKDNLLSFPGKYFNSASGLLTLTSSKNAGTGGTMIVFAEYSVIM